MFSVAQFKELENILRPYSRARAIHMFATYSRGSQPQMSHGRRIKLMYAKSVNEWAPGTRERTTLLKMV